MKYIMIDEKQFEHLLNCMANQKFIHEQKPEIQKEWQKTIDEAWDGGMKLLSLNRMHLNTWPPYSTHHVDERELRGLDLKTSID